MLSIILFIDIIFSFGRYIHLSQYGTREVLIEGCLGTTNLVDFHLKSPSLKEFNEFEAHPYWFLEVLELVIVHNIFKQNWGLFQQDCYHHTPEDIICTIKDACIHADVNILFPIRLVVLLILPVLFI